MANVNVLNLQGRFDPKQPKGVESALAGFPDSLYALGTHAQTRCPVLFPGLQTTLNPWQPLQTPVGPCQIPASLPNLTRSTAYGLCSWWRPFPLLQLTTRLGLAIQLKQVAKGANLRSFLYHARDLSIYNLEPSFRPTTPFLSLTSPKLTTLFSLLVVYSTLSA